MSKRSRAGWAVIVAAALEALGPIVGKHYIDAYLLPRHFDPAAMGMLLAADRAFVIEPKSPQLGQVPGATVVADFDELCALLPEPMLA